jgi:hypothetical protein
MLDVSGSQWNQVNGRLQTISLNLRSSATISRRGGFAALMQNISGNLACARLRADAREMRRIKF